MTTPQEKIETPHKPTPPTDNLHVQRVEEAARLLDEAEKARANTPSDVTIEDHRKAYEEYVRSRR